MPETNRTQYTPGPWGVAPDGYHEAIYRQAYHEHDRTVIANVLNNGDRETMRANAQLIYAAPDLVDELRRLIDEAERVNDYPKGGRPPYPGLTYAIEMARAALDKATFRIVDPTP